MGVLGDHAAPMRWPHDNPMPLWRYHTDGRWESTARSLRSPAADGSIAYLIDTLSPLMIRDDGPLYDDGIARAACQYLKALAVKHSLEVADGPYLQLREDDGAVPRGFVMLRALMWCDEFDFITPMDDESVSPLSTRSRD
jgi:hypothetical protein